MPEWYNNCVSDKTIPVLHDVYKAAFYGTCNIFVILITSSIALALRSGCWVLDVEYLLVKLPHWAYQTNERLPNLESAAHDQNDK